MAQVLEVILEIIRQLLNKEPPAPEKITSVGSTRLIREFEGLELKAYKCPAGVLTIGYGHTKEVAAGMVITEGKAEALLREDLVWVEEAINTKVVVPLTQNQYDALASFIYNVGAGAFTKSTLLRKLNAEDYSGASAEFKRWNKASGKVLRGLVRRRKAEQELFDE